jgi:hypothetical protein
MKDYSSVLSKLCMMNLTNDTIERFLAFLESNLKTCLQQIAKSTCDLRQSHKYGDKKQLIMSFYEDAKRIRQKHFDWSPPEIKLEETNKEIMGPYYLDGTFTYNPTNSVVNSDVLKMVVIHETEPGHHYMFTYMDARALPVDDDNIAYIEGWALYAESLSGETDKCKYYMSRLIRLLRSIGDIYINYQNRDQKVVRDLFAKHNHLAHLDIDKEIHRIEDKPGYNVCYVMGEQQFFQLRKQFRKKFPEKSLVDFHKFVLGQGVVPFDKLKEDLH